MSGIQRDCCSMLAMSYEDDDVDDGVIVRGVEEVSDCSSRDECPRQARGKPENSEPGKGEGAQFVTGKCCPMM